MIKYQLVAVGVLCCGARVSRADGLFPSLPSLKNIDVGFGAETVVGSKAWGSADAITSVRLELGFTLWTETDQVYKIDPTTHKAESNPDGTVATQSVPGGGAVVAFAGTFFGSASGDLSASLRANASLRDNYVGANYTYQWCPNFGVFVGGDVRFVSFDSGRAYENDPNRTAFKLSGSGYGGEIHGGFGFLKYGFVGASVTGRYFPSVILDPPSGVTLPPTAPESVRFGTIGVMVGVQLVTDPKERPINAIVM